MDRGEVWWADLPLPIGRRPVLILTRSSVHNLPSEVALARSDGMPQQCVVNCDVLITVPKPRLLRRITGLSIAKMADVNQAVRFALDLG
jgi:mRNA interferase MazF